MYFFVSLCERGWVLFFSLKRDKRWNFFSLSAKPEVFLEILFFSPSFFSFLVCQSASFSYPGFPYKRGFRVKFADMASAQFGYQIGVQVTSTVVAKIPLTEAIWSGHYLNKYLHTLSYLLISLRTYYSSSLFGDCCVSGGLLQFLEKERHLKLSFAHIFPTSFPFLIRKYFSFKHFSAPHTA